MHDSTDVQKAKAVLIYRFLGWAGVPKCMHAGHLNIETFKISIKPASMLLIKQQTSIDAFYFYFF